MTKILFVCTGNSFRSPVAEALAQKYKPSLKVSSAGTHPAEMVAQNGKNLLNKEKALKYVKDQPEKVTQQQCQTADRIIVMQQDHKQFIKENLNIPSEKIENWQIKDPINPDVRAEDSFQRIKQKIQSL